MPHQTEVTSAAFRADGGELLTVGYAWEALRWDLTPQPRSPEEWLLLAGVQSGRRFDQTRAMVPLSGKELAAASEELSRRHPGDLTCPPQQRKDWYLQEMQRDVLHQRRDDAGDLGDEAVAAWPEDAGVRLARHPIAARQGRHAEALADMVAAASRYSWVWPYAVVAYRRAGKVEEGVAELSRRLKAEPANPYLWLARSDLHEAAERRRVALDDLEQAQKCGCDPVRLEPRRGNLLAELGRWADARDAFARAAADIPSRHDLFAAHLLTLLQSDGPAAFEKALRARGPYADYLASPRPEVSAALALLLVLLPGPDAPLARGLVDQALAARPKDPSFLRIRGLVLMRLKQHAEAVKAVRQAVEAEGKDGSVLTWVTLALAHAAAGEQDESRRWLARVDDWLAGLKDQGVHWTARLEVRLLRKEAGGR